MKRVLVFGLNGNKYGGINVFLLTMQENMKNCVFDYVIEGPKNVNEKDIKKSGGLCFYIPYFKKNPFKYFFSIKKILKSSKGKYDTVYFNLFSMVHASEMYVAKKLKFRVVAHAHNNYVEKGFLYKIIHNINRFLFGKMNCVRLTNSQLSATFMFGEGQKREALLIYNGIDLQKFKFNNNVRQRVRNFLNLQNNFVVGFSGRLQMQKNVFFLIDVFEQILLKKKNSVLIIAGEGILEKELIDYISAKNLSQNILMLGQRDDMFDLYQAMDLFLLPSLFEGLGIVLIEAQCSGLPSITSAEVVPDIAQISSDLLLYIPLHDSPDEWAEQSLRFYQKAPCREIGYNCAVKTGFDIKKEALKLEKILLENCNCNDEIRSC